MRQYSLFAVDTPLLVSNNTRRGIVVVAGATSPAFPRTVPILRYKRVVTFLAENPFVPPKYGDRPKSYSRGQYEFTRWDRGEICDWATPTIDQCCRELLQSKQEPAQVAELSRCPSRVGDRRC